MSDLLECTWGRSRQHTPPCAALRVLPIAACILLLWLLITWIPGNSTNLLKYRPSVTWILLGLLESHPYKSKYPQITKWNYKDFSLCSFIGTAQESPWPKELPLNPLYISLFSPLFVTATHGSWKKKNLSLSFSHSLHHASCKPLTTHYSHSFISWPHNYPLQFLLSVSESQTQSGVWVEREALGTSDILLHAVMTGMTWDNNPGSVLAGTQHSMGMVL